MSKVSRITISLEETLLENFEKYLNENGFPSRSEGIKHLMRNALVEQDWKKGTNVAGTISLVYDHHKSGVMEKLVDVQHQFESLVVCTQHVHLDHHNCMEVLVLKGDAGDIRDLFTKIKSIKGLKHSSVMMGTTGGNLG